jgi:hypothetical protein
MTREESLKDCIKLWSYLAKYPECSKSRAVHDLELDYLNIKYAFCPACYYAMQESTEDENMCVNCPIWGPKISSCIFNEYSKWLNAESIYMKTYWATKIKNKAELKLKEIQ